MKGERQQESPAQKKKTSSWSSTRSESQATAAGCGRGSSRLPIAQSWQLRQAETMPTLLIIEDNPGDLFLVQEVLGGEGSAEWRFVSSETLSGALEILGAAEVDVDAVLLDLALPDSKGLASLKKLLEVTPLIPVVILTGFADEVLGNEAIRMGAQDYLRKEALDGPHLDASLRFALQRNRLQLELEDARLRLAQTNRLASAGILAGGVAHELNNPLTSIAYNLMTVVEDIQSHCAEARHEDHEELRDALSRLSVALQDADRMRKILVDLQVFSAADMGRVAPLSVNDTIDSVINMALATISSRARLVKLYGELPLIMASQGRLAQVFLNLLLSAAQSIEKGNPDQNEISIRTRIARQRILVEVTDTGAGFDDETLKKIFEPFFITSGRQWSTSCLGLSICQRVVSEMDGDVEVESIHGQGTRVRVSFPFETADSSGAEDPVSGTLLGQFGKEEQSDEEGHTGRGRVLLVDDEEGIGIAIKRMFRREYDVIVVNSGEEALDRLENDGDFDAILCDLIMPGLNGVELYEQAVSERPELGPRFLFISGGTARSDLQERVVELGRTLLRKPMKPADLRQYIISIMKNGNTN